MDSGVLLEKLPVYNGKKELITGKQSVNDIIGEILKAHRLFAPDYDKIVLYFNNGDTKKICASLYRFCKNKINYKMESELSQTVKSPSAILAQGYGDCKHYASFTGGILGALNRIGKKIDWHYRFASYDWFNKTPGHIFVVVVVDGKEIWIDPTPGADKTSPVWVVNKKAKDVMALYKVSGVGQKDYPISQLLDDTANDGEIYNAIQILLKYGVMDANARLSDKVFYKLQNTVSAADLQNIAAAYNLVRAAGIGGFFSTIWRGVKKVTLLAPRNAYLALVGINAFGFATKLSNAIWNKDGSYTSFKDKLKTTWQDRLGGDWTALQNTIRKGATKKAILGAAPTIPAWVAVASAVIAAIMPLVNAFLKSKQQQTGENYNIDPNTGLPFGQAPYEGATNADQETDTLTYLKNNPALLVGGAAVLYLFLRKK